VRRSSFVAQHVRRVPTSVHKNHKGANLLNGLPERSSRLPRMR
jgi:hypothetical protein